ncbi:ABC transporter ATP-binding protein [Marinomonas primoryensis]|jgi:iron(III) transport system ATP-binding protein|uniref:ABC transporter ATP-binding protein n=1 Tax=Marinomonas primoryensis TaxID=178399 RepID=A0A2Z4PXT6_9GAMM|nr:ABC transporter ATP-binding protein [Marinomonas primoryensis]AWY01959.1 ABC transporter ATP-binding protein [Marinomonas primoryensis]QKK81745.1 Ferric iron ABC transporter ATP-binding protein [Marinomonas primoryensis]|tara:strand:+ start:4999 stop:6066 length:1068 start_codon:yes stop_codon:yes gene_type:complete
MASLPLHKTLKEMTLTNVSVGYDGGVVVKNAAFQLLEGQIGCLLGPSGCGKSTLLRAIAGFESLMTGEIMIDDQIISNSSLSVNPEDRHIGMVFQDIALFPHLTIAQNIAFGLSSWSKESAQERVAYLLELVGLAGFQSRYPHSLSGGQQQRVALARAIAPKPKLLLMDEPFSGLDAKLREELVPDIRDILQHEKMSALLVTHDQMEAFAMADQVSVMDAGVIHQTGSPYQIYHRPETRFVASFIGHGDFLSATVCGPDCVHSDLGNIRGDLDHGFADNALVDLLVRPDDILHDDDSAFVGVIVSKWFRGSHFLYRVKLSSGKVVYCFASSHHNHALGQKIGLSVHLDHLVLFPR